MCVCVANGCTYMFDSLGSEGVNEIKKEDIFSDYVSMKHAFTCAKRNQRTSDAM